MLSLIKIEISNSIDRRTHRGSFPINITSSDPRNRKTPYKVPFNLARARSSLFVKILFFFLPRRYIRGIFHSKCRERAALDKNDPGRSRDRTLADVNEHYAKEEAAGFRVRRGVVSLASRESRPRRCRAARTGYALNSASLGSTLAANGPTRR